MAQLQKQFEQFHDEIRLDDKNKELAEKRERILTRLGESIKARRAEGEEIPRYEHINQGSYAMKTGIRPLDEDYDIDVALLFDLDKDDYPDPVTVKKWVLDALENHTSEVRMRGPCVTVVYKSGGEPKFHVDLAVYANACSDGRTYLARGKLGSSDEFKVWEESDPRALITAIKDKFKSDNGAQGRRVIRYLKRWKDVRWSSTDGGRPPGIALTAAAYHDFRPRVFSDGAYDDLAATLQLVEQLLANFVPARDSDLGNYERLSLHLPVAPGNDLLEDKTARQMTTLRDEFLALREALQEAVNDVDPHSAAKKLAKVFGDGFPVPSKEETATPRGPAYVTSGHSA